MVSSMNTVLLLASLYAASVTAQTTYPNITNRSFGTGTDSTVVTDVATTTDLCATGTDSNGQCGGYTKCNTTHPTNFNNFPSNTPFVAFGSVKLSGDVDCGRMKLGFGGHIAKGSSQPAKMLKMTLDHFDISHLWFKKNNSEVDQRVVRTSDGCTDCEVIVSIDTDGGGHPPPSGGGKCPTPMDIIMAIDVSKSITNTPGLSDNIITLAQGIAVGIDIGKGDNKSRFALTTFSDSAQKEWTLDSNSATSAQMVQSGIAHVNFTNGYSNHASSIDSAAIELRTRGRWGQAKAFILVADGKPNKDVQRIEPALKHIRTIKGLCLIIVGVNITEGSEDDSFFRHALGCSTHGSCPNLILVSVRSPEALAAGTKLALARICACTAACEKPGNGPQSVTTFTLRLDGVILADFGSREEVNRAVDGLLVEASSAMGVSRDRLRAIAIEDTAGVSIENMDQGYSQNREATSTSSSSPRQTMVEVLFHDPGANIEPESQDSVRRLSQLLGEPQSSLVQGLASQGLGSANVERMALRAYEGNMPILDVLQT